ncbi:diaminopimelate decarboxylase 2 chloroplastic [Citrus sinensis]|uniref:Diaminopimelate decarboxylase 2 chloroplastic n=1 Tax=Citrus sinensis TaxID=2711 RepID=A0ACB8MB26_CITSI|nr:diaminopimelate decarboxylase 2 chloroplastic [Citrus sinensis]
MASCPKGTPSTLLHLDAQVMGGQRVTTVVTKDELTEFMQSTILKRQEFDEVPFYLMDLGVVVSLYNHMISNLPMIHPHYAVKCNPEPALLEALAALGSNFDCGSRSEIEAVLLLDVSPDRIIYANPCKPVSHIKYAASVGVNLTTFDSVEELDKIRNWHPKSDLLIRIKSPDDSGAKYPLDSKYGADHHPQEIMPLLKAAEASGLSVVGVSFHVGSEATNFAAFRGAIAAAKAVFDTAARTSNNKMRVLDIGGGFSFTNSNPKLFQEAASIIKEALQAYFPNELLPGSSLKVISEPGRFFAASAFTLYAQIIGKRVRGELREYWINDGKFGSLAWVTCDEAIAKCTPLPFASSFTTSKGLTRTYNSTVFGPTCDAFDEVFTGHKLPELEVNDWLVFSEMGAYTTACGTNFNGYSTVAIPTYVVRSNQTLLAI